jgi:hypothetical protein
LHQFITEGAVPPEIPQLDKRLEPRLIRGLYRAEEVGLSDLLRDWEVIGLIISAGADSGVYLWACQTQRAPFSFSYDVCGVLAEETNQISVDDL